jgi:uncharacterized protein
MFKPPSRAGRNLPGMSGADIQSQPTPTAIVPPVIVARNFRADLRQEQQRHWVRSDPFATAFFNALSAVFPHGETFMIRSMVAWQDRVPSPLNEQVAAFIEQEAGHSREHVAMNKALIEAGYNVEPLERRIKGFVGFFEDAGDITKLTATMCIEHFTAIVAAEILGNERHLKGADEQMRELWLWHAVEEVEHKAVAFDVWRYATRSWSPFRRYAVRCGAMIAITASFFINRTLGQIELLRQDGYAFMPALKGVLRSGFGNGGLGRNVLRRWRAFFRPDFHPWQHDDRLLLATAEAELATIRARRSGLSIGSQPQIDQRPVALVA